MKKIVLAITGLSLLAFACTKDFEELNTNPNAPEQIAPEFLLTNVITVSAEQNGYTQGLMLASYLAQHGASVEFERIDRYEMGSNGDYWNTLFRLLSDIRSIKEAEASNEAYQAVGDIMQSYIFSQLTDMWGDVPYSQAVQALDGNFTPAYDSQEFIYTDAETGILAVLQNAANTLNNTNFSIRGDVMFGNDLEKWVRFANSLQVRYLMRMSKRFNEYPALQARLQTLVDGGMLMTGNADNAVVPYLSSAPNQYPMFNAAQGGYQEHRMTVTVDSVLTLWNDPRVNVLFKPTQASVTAGNPEFNGLLNGQSRETISQNGVDLNDVSLFGAIFRDVPNGIDAQFMQYSELQFALAEAVQKGFINGSATTYYEAGIAASFEYYSVSLPADYTSRAAIQLDGTEDLNRIMTQKWLALFNCGHEPWFNVRRTGMPYLKPGPDNFNNDMYPSRYLYPEGEQATNAANYQNAVNSMGPDNINTKCWWQQ